MLGAVDIVEGIVLTNLPSGPRCRFFPFLLPISDSVWGSLFGFCCRRGVQSTLSSPRWSSVECE